MTVTGALTQVLIATVAFVGTHLLMSHPLRGPMVARLGERGFQGVYSLVSLATFGWLIRAMLRVGPESLLWTARPWVWLVAGGVMLVASILFVGSLIGNPALLGMPGGAGEPRGVLAITRHPMMWSFALWAFVHALVWPQPSVLVLCTGSPCSRSPARPDRTRRKRGFSLNSGRDGAPRPLSCPSPAQPRRAPGGPAGACCSAALPCG